MLPGPAGGIGAPVAQLQLRLDGRDGIAVDVTGPIQGMVPMSKPILYMQIQDRPRGHAAAVASPDITRVGSRL